MIPEEVIETIKDKINIYDVVNSYVDISKYGKNNKGLCPFHREKTPSLIINANKNIYKCFGCGRGGSPIDFIKQRERRDFPNTIRYLLYN